MVAYNLMLAVFPFALIVLFVFGQVVNSDDIEPGSSSTSGDSSRTPNRKLWSTRTTLSGPARRRSGSPPRRLYLDRRLVLGGDGHRFCRIYHVECRGWWEQKRFSLGMLVVVALFIVGAASVVLPAGGRRP